MEFLSKYSKVKNSAAALIVFFAWYISAALTVLLVEQQLEVSLRNSAIILFCVVVFMSWVFGLSRIVKRTDVVDAAWGPAFIVAAITAFMLNGYGLSIGVNVQTLVTALIMVWGARLSFTITRRLLKKPEDARYIQLRKTWSGNMALNTYARIFVIQAILATLISGAIIHVNLALPASIGWYAYVGAAVWVIGFVFEVVGDWQLKRHLSNPKNKGVLMTSGLWKYTRHPNYFGEATMWWGIFIIALQVPYGWLGIVTPVVITYLLLFVSGVPMTEKAFEGRAGWKTYKARTSIFIPWLPKNN